MKTPLALFLAVLLASLGGSVGAEPARASSPPAISLSSAVNWDFDRLDKLDAWRNTAAILRKTLGQWSAAPVPGAAVENTSPASLRAFFAGLPRAGDWSIVYLASHQTRGGRWQFPRDPEQTWPALLAGAPAAQVPRLIILDACFAEAAGREVLMTGTGASGLVFAAARAEEVHELNFHRRFPLDLARRYPAEAGWLRDALGADWNGRVSFFGFIWLRAFLATPQPPRTLEDWSAFFQRCENLAREFRQGRGKALASAIHFVTRFPTVSTEAHQPPTAGRQ